MIHGLLHLFGYDHLTPAQAARMERLEKEIMATLGLPDPYEILTP
jgi:probable rRNA maturation factor